MISDSDIHVQFCFKLFLNSSTHICSNQKCFPSSNEKKNNWKYENASVILRWLMLLRNLCPPRCHLWSRLAYRHRLQKYTYARTLVYSFSLHNAHSIWRSFCRKCWSSVRENLFNSLWSEIKSHFCDIRFHLKWIHLHIFGEFLPVLVNSLVVN